MKTLGQILTEKNAERAANKKPVKSDPSYVSLNSKSIVKSIVKRDHLVWDWSNKPVIK